MARRVDQVECVDLPVGCGIVKRDGAGLDRDAALALQVHVVEDLVLHLARRNGVALFKKPIRQRRLAVVDVRDDGKISDVLFVHSCCSCFLSARRRRAPNGASKRFALEQNLAAGRIHFARGCSIKRVPARASALVGKRLAVVDVRDDGEIADVLFVHNFSSLFPAEQGIGLLFGAVEHLRHALHEAGVERGERLVLHGRERAVLFRKCRERGGVGDVVRAHLRVHRAGLVGRGF